MAIKTTLGKYRCSYCYKEYSKDQEADDCRLSHKLVYLALTEKDLNRLYNFINLKDDDLLTDSLVRQITKLVKGVNAKLRTI